MRAKKIDQNKKADQEADGNPKAQKKQEMSEEQKVITKEKHGQPMVIHWNKMLDEQKAVAKGKNRQEVTNYCNIIPDREKQPIGHLFSSITYSPPKWICPGAAAQHTMHCTRCAGCLRRGLGCTWLIVRAYH